MGRKVEKKKRGIYTRKQKKLILISAEGKNETEKLYFSHFNQLQNEYHIIFAKGRHTDPEGVVKDLVKEMRQLDIRVREGDIAACFIDVDQYKNRYQQLSNALILARMNGIEIYYSNPCFELWFLLHFRYSTKQYISNEELLDEIKQYIPMYKKSYDVFHSLHPRIVIAIDNAKRLENYHDKLQVTDRFKRLPSTDVYKIIGELTKHISA